MQARRRCVLRAQERVRMGTGGAENEIGVYVLRVPSFPHGWGLSVFVG
jgi:hypothetical protein